MARPEIDRVEPDEVESMPRNNSAGKPNQSSETALSSEFAASCCFGLGNDAVRGEHLAATRQGVSAPQDEIQQDKVWHDDRNEYRFQERRRA
jgi:hypothetical protein